MHQAGLPFLVAAVLPYLAAVGFLVGVLYRLAVWRRLPQPGTMTLFPTQGSGPLPLAGEALLFPSLYRGDRLLWTLAWLFHVTLALAFLGHLRIVTALIDRALGRFGVGPAAVGAVSTFAGGVAGIFLLIALAGFLVRRLVVRRVREISTAPDFAALLLLTGVIASGNLMRWSGPPEVLLQARVWFASLLSLAPIVPHSASLLLHAFLAELLLLYIAFSKLMHFGGFFLTFSLTKRTDP